MRTLFSICLGVLLSIAAFIPGVSAQDKLTKIVETKVVDGGVINGKATSLPKPEYPEAAKNAGRGGMVGVNVIIDEAGNVIFAQAELFEQKVRMSADGATSLDSVEVPLELREAAEAAARQAKFSPTSLSGQPVKVKGKIVYNFSPGPGNTAIPPGSISGGVLNGKALALPAPAYPAAAKAVRAEGSVAVQILINEEGDVISATTVSGHPLLRAASEAAAREAKFSPTQLSGKPVKVSGVMMYKFELPAKSDQ